MNRALLTVGICLSVSGSAMMTSAASLQQKIVTRVDTAKVMLKHRTLVITATGMGRTPTAMGRGGKLVRRNSDRPLNKDGLVEYELVFFAVPNYSGFKMKPIKATLSDRSVPEGVKGARVFGEYNQVDAMIPAAKEKKSLFSFGKKRRNKAADETAGAITEGSPHP
jgi:hypothetical protein